MADIKTYPTDKHSVEELIQHMTDFFAERNMHTLRVDSPDGNLTVIQARISGGSVKQFVGMDKAVTLRFVKGNSQVSVEIGEAKWADKAATMTVSMFVLFPLSITSVIGIYGQRKLMKKIPDEIHSFMTDTPSTTQPRLISKGITAVGDTAQKAAKTLTDNRNIQWFLAKMGSVMARELTKIMSR